MRHPWLVGRAPADPARLGSPGPRGYRRRGGLRACRLVARAPGGGRRRLAPGGRQLRQRLQRRGPGNRRRPGRPAQAGRRPGRLRRGRSRRAALVAFAVAGAAGLALAAVAGWWLVAVGAACVAAAWLYTGGPRPYGYVGLGEVSVFAFFGVVATMGTAYVQTEKVTGLELLAALPVGLLAVSLLVVNNLRDIPGDTAAGKRTLAVRFGPTATRRFYEGCVLGAVVAIAPIAFEPALGLAGPGGTSVGRRCRSERSPRGRRGRR